MSLGVLTWQLVEMFRVLLPTLLLQLLSLASPGRASDLWAFDPPRRTEVPAGKHPVDYFIDSRLAASGIEPLPPAGSATLLRRLFLDLTGLPPAPADVAAFESEWSRHPDSALTALVDRLLDSPHFAERWTRHWLDLARYADSDGYLGDTERAWAWRYRDWVVEAIDRDLPYDQFSIAQIAGDLLSRAGESDRIAAGFHRNALLNTEAGVDKELSRTKQVVDRVNAVSTTWLGLTLACAECHNHKHDPVKQDEFYRVYAFFNNLDDEDPVVPLPGETERYRENLAAWEKQTSALESLLAQETEAMTKRQTRWEAELSRNLPTNPWTVLLPEKAESGAGDTMKIEGDGSILVTAKKSDPDTVTYTLEFPVPEGLSAIGAFRLEALGSPGEGREPGVASGRGKDGAFVLSAFSAQRRGPDGKLQTLAAADGKDPIWEAREGVRRYQARGFPLAKAVSVAESDRLVLTLRHKAGGATTLRRFRLSATADPQAKASDLPDPVLAALRTDPDKRTEEQRILIAIHFRSLDSTWMAKRLDLDRQLAKVPQKPSSKIQTVKERTADRHENYVHVRGDYQRRGDSVTSGVPAVLHPLKPRRAGGEADRLDFAQWLFDEANPLTARVAVNQIWQHLFGTGIVATPDDFGTEGAAPTHPELLDWLATEYRRLGWSRKKLIRLIVTSEAYRRSSAIPETPPVDATDNTLLWRQNRFRVEAETVRDLHLAACGLLSLKTGGKPVRPPLPGFVTEVGRSVAWPVSEGEDRYRRGLYIFLKRTVMYPSLIAFDAPDTSVACSRRDRTQSPMQALTLLNDPVFFECAEALGKTLTEAHRDDPDAAIEEIFHRCLGRDPEPAELDALRSAHADFLTSSDKERAYVATARVVMNLDEFITRE
ncbi:MAG: DUF1553 domain-containing protein [Verrucomicrobiae bacterium]|nr:DUF1553 domain-containing protein [Verrucomicrobiae bacterium]